MAKLIATFDDSERQALAVRARKQKPSGQPFPLTDLQRMVHFLRGVGTRASMALPAFYFFIGATDRERSCSIEGYPGVVFLHSTEFSSCSTISLCCRKVFDHARGMTGNSFSRLSDLTLSEIATYWSKSSGRPVDDAARALKLLRNVIRECSQSPTALLEGDGTVLGRRVALLKQHADRVAAHLSLDNYEFSLMDVAHVVAALAILGETVISFDDASRGPQFFNELDKASHDAAKALFPNLSEHRLFDGIAVSALAQRCWSEDPAYGARLIIDHLPYTTGWY